MDKEACLDPSHAFQDYDTFSQCFYLWAGANMTTTPKTSLSQNNTFGDVIHRCVSSYCDSASPDLGGCGSRSGLWGGSYDLSIQPSISFFTTECSDINQHPNTDIAGPGVALSFMLQLTILGYIWVALRLLDAISRIKRIWESQMRMHLIQKITEHRPVIQFILIEFQEAQSSFLLAIQVASIYVMSKKPELFGAVNLLQLTANKITTRSICLEAIAFVTFGFWLHKTDMKSWYILFCSTLTVILSIITFHISIYWTVIPANLSLPQDGGGLYECGHHPPPLVWCAYWVNDNSGDPFVIGSFVTSISLFFYLFCQTLLVQLKVGPWARQNLRDSKHEWRRAVYYCINGFLPTSGWIRLTFNICVELMLLAIIGLSTMKLFQPFYINLTDWNFGQVIAVSIWAPVIVKYFYWSLFGVEAYSADRIPSPYKITNTETHVPPTDDIYLSRRLTV